MYVKINRIKNIKNKMFKLNSGKLIVSSGINKPKGERGKRGGTIRENGGVDFKLKSVNGISGFVEVNEVGKHLKSGGDEIDDISDIIDQLAADQEIETGEENLSNIGPVDNEKGLISSLKSKLLKILKIKEDAHLDDQVCVDIATTKTEEFKTETRERLLGMGVDKYIKNNDETDDFIFNIVKDFKRNTKRILNFGLAFRKDKSGEERNISIEANDFIDSVNLDRVVVRVNNNSKESGQNRNIELGEYLEAVEMDAVSAMEALKEQRTSLTPDVSRWFGAVQRMVGMPKEGEPFRNYLQRAMSQKYEVDGNLNHPDRENIESALREVVPLLHRTILSERLGGKLVGDSVLVKNVGQVPREMQTNEGGQGPSNVFRVDRGEQFSEGYVNKRKRSKKGWAFRVDDIGEDTVAGEIGLNEVVAEINSDKITRQAESIDLSEYLEVVDMNAARALSKLRRLGFSLKFNVRNWLEATQAVLGAPEDTESLEKYLQRALASSGEIDNKLSNTNQENIKEVLKSVVPVLHKSILLDRFSK